MSVGMVLRNWKTVTAGPLPDGFPDAGIKRMEIHPGIMAVGMVLRNWNGGKT